MFRKIFNRSSRKVKTAEFSQNYESIFESVESVFANVIYDLKGSQPFSMESISLEQLNEESKIFALNLFENNRYIKRIGDNFQVSNQTNFEKQKSDMIIVAEDLSDYIYSIVTNKTSASYIQRHTAIIWNTLFDDEYFTNRRANLANHLAEFLQSGHTYRIIDLGTGNGDIFLPLLEKAEAGSISMEIDLIDKAPTFINFLNRKVFQSVSQRISKLKDRGVDFNFAFHNYNFLDEIWELDKFKEDINYVLMSFCSEHLSDDELISLGKKVREIMTPDGVFFIMEGEKSAKKALRSLFCFGDPIMTTEDPYSRIRRTLSDVFSTIEMKDNIIELA